MDGMNLPPDLEPFAQEAVAAGRYRDVAELVAAGVSLLRHREAARAEFVASLEAAEAESERDGWHSAEDVHADMAALINEARCRQA
jgi:putative addiction module CopG family antidote